MWRSIRLTLLFIALGLLTTLAIAVGCGLTLDPPYGRERGHVAVRRSFIINGIPWSAGEWQRMGASVIMWDEITRDFFTPFSNNPTSGTPNRAREDPQMLMRDFLASEAESAARQPQPIPSSTSPGVWGSFTRGRAPTPLSEAESANGAYISGNDYGYGWPCIALWFQSTGWTNGNRFDTTAYNGAILVSGQPGVVINCRCRVIPYYPAWTGIILNALLYSALWAALVLGLQAVRRARRRRHNQCLNCGYDLSKTPPRLPCPECGRPAT